MPMLGKAGAGRRGRRAAAPPPPAPAPAPAPAEDPDPEPEQPPTPEPAARQSKVQFAEKQPTPREVPANQTKKRTVQLDSDDESDRMSAASDATGTTGTSGDDLLAELGIESHASLFGGKKKPLVRKTLSAKKADKPADGAELTRTQTVPVSKIEKEKVEKEKAKAKAAEETADDLFGPSAGRVDLVESSTPAVSDAIEKLFSRADRTNRGLVTRVELIAVVSAEQDMRAAFGVPEGADRSQMSRVFEDMDRGDESKGVSLSDFAQFVRQQFANFPGPSPVQQQLLQVQPQPQPEPEPEPEPQLESDPFGLKPFGLAATQQQPQPPQQQQAGSPAAGSPQGKENQKPSEQKVSEWLDGQSEGQSGEQEDEIYVIWHAEGGEGDGEYDDGSGQKEGQFNAYLAKVKNPSEAMDVLEELCERHRENVEDDGPGKWHCFSHAYRVTDPVRKVVRHHCGDKGMGGEGTGRLIAELLEMSKPVADNVILAVMWYERGNSVLDKGKYVSSSAPAEMGVASPQICCARSLLERMGFRSCFERGAIAQCPDCPCKIKATRVTDTLLCRNPDCEFKLKLDALEREQPPAGTDFRSHAHQRFEAAARDLGKRLYGSFEPADALTQAIENGDINDFDIEVHDQYRQLMLRMQIRPIHTIGGMWLQPHQLLLGEANAKEALEMRHRANLDENVRECSKEQAQLYNPHQVQTPAEAVPPPREERERVRQRQQQQRLGRTKSGGGNSPATARRRNHYDPYPASVISHGQTAPDLASEATPTEGAEPDDEELKIAQVSSELMPRHAMSISSHIDLYI
jgi:hypothetical protein